MYIFFLCRPRILLETIHSIIVIIHASNRAMNRFVDYIFSCFFMFTAHSPAQHHCYFHFRLLLYAFRLSFKLNSLSIWSLTTSFLKFHISFPRCPHHHIHDPPGLVRSKYWPILYFLIIIIHVKTAVHGHIDIMTSPPPPDSIVRSPFNLPKKLVSCFSDLIILNTFVHQIPHRVIL